MKLHIAKRTFLLASVFIILAPATAGALSDSQVNVLNLGIRYFNTEDTVSASSSCTGYSIRHINPVALRLTSNGLTPLKVLRQIG